MGGGVSGKVDDLGRGGVGHPLDVQKKPRKNLFFGQKKLILGVSVVRIGVRHLPPPSLDRNIFWSGLQNILRFGRFYARYGPDVREGGVSAKRTFFGRTSLMDDPSSKINRFS